MISFILCIFTLAVGYVFYGKFAENIFSPDDRKTPAYTMADKVDFVPIGGVKAFLIQLLNIAGTGPIFGALMGAVFGPAVFLWIVAGSIFMGAVHDYFTGMISERNKGASIAALTGIYMGDTFKHIISAFSVILLILVGTVFITSPASLLSQLTGNFAGKDFWKWIIIIYYLTATVFPIDKLIGKVYPFFGAVLILTAILVGGGVFWGEYNIPEISLKNMHPQGTMIWPFMFVTVACGAISGFHATQSPLMSRCIKSEKQGRGIFYGAMIAEAVIALIWAGAGLAYFKNTSALESALNSMGQSAVVYEISQGILGKTGAVLAIVGVIICPVTSGDTAFRSARVIIAQWLGLKQDKAANRLILSVPLLLIGVFLSGINFDVLWRYFSWSNQTLAMITLWCISSYLIKNTRGVKYLIAAIPAFFMTAVSVTYILMADEGLKFSYMISYPLGLVFAILCLVVCIKYANCGTWGGPSD